MSKSIEHERSFFRMVQVSSALGMGTAAAFAFSIDHITPSFKMSFTWGTILAFIFGAAASWYLWSIVQEARNSGVKPSLRRKMIIWGLFLCLATVASFAHGLKNYSREKVIEFAIGSGTAIFFLAVGSALFYVVVSFLNKDYDDQQ